MNVRTIAKETVKKFSDGMDPQHAKMLEDTLVKGYEPLFNEIEAGKKAAVSEENIDEMIESFEPKLSPKEKEETRVRLLKVLKEGKSPGEALGITENILELMYMNAYKQYQTGNFRDALSTFQLLEWLEPSRLDFSFSVAACYQMLKNYENALFKFVKLSFQDPDNPLPLFHAAECFKQKGLHELAWGCLQDVIKRCGEDPQLSKICEKSKIMADAEKVLANSGLVQNIE